MTKCESREHALLDTHKDLEAVVSLDRKLGDVVAGGQVDLAVQVSSLGEVKRKSKNEL